MSQELYTVVTRKGQITVPAQIRRALKIKEGDRIALSIREGADSEAVLRPVRSVVESSYGIARSTGQVVDLDSMRGEFERGLAEDALDGVASPGETQ